MSFQNFVDDFDEFLRIQVLQAVQMPIGLFRQFQPVFLALSHFGVPPGLPNVPEVTLGRDFPSGGVIGGCQKTLTPNEVTDEQLDCPDKECRSTDWISCYKTTCYKLGRCVRNSCMNKKTHGTSPGVWDKSHA